MFGKLETKDEYKLLNWYLIIGWSVIAAILVITYAIEVLKKNFTPLYYGVFLGVVLIPFLICCYRYQKNINIRSLKYWIFAGYFLMYGFVLLTGHTNLVFTYIFPLMSLIILYHDSAFVLQVGACTLILNIASIGRDYHLGKITVTNSRDYEIQIALILLCFFGCYLATRVYGRISQINKEKEQEVLQLQEERIILEERNRYALIDSLTELGNRRKYDEYLDQLKKEFKPFYIVMVDINGLKEMNDTSGHVAGDELIVGMAHCIKTAFDKDNDECFRFGGDEFAIITHSDKEVFERKLLQLRENVLLWRGVHAHKLTAAMGYALVDQVTKTEKAVRLADEQMYQDKRKYYERVEHDRRIRNNRIKKN